MFLSIIQENRSRVIFWVGSPWKTHKWWWFLPNGRIFIPKVLSQNCLNVLQCCSVPLSPKTSQNSSSLMSGCLGTEKYFKTFQAVPDLSILRQMQKKKKPTKKVCSHEDNGRGLSIPDDPSSIQEINGDYPHIWPPSISRVQPWPDLHSHVVSIAL